MLSIDPTVGASRSYRFEASHTSGLDPSILGIKESKIHGHNFKLEVNTVNRTLKNTGLSVDLNDLDEFVNKITKGLDHKNLTSEYFDLDLPITHEFLTCYISDRILSALEYVKMISLTTGVEACYPSKNGWSPHKVYTYGGIFMKHKIYSERSYQFSASHKLYNNRLSQEKNNKLYGKCTNLHGHDYTLFVTVSGIPNRKTGLIVSYRKLDRIVNQIIKKLDCKILGDCGFLKGIIPTSENIIMAIWKELKDKIDTRLVGTPSSGYDIELHEITLQETSRNFFTYRGGK